MNGIGSNSIDSYSDDELRKIKRFAMMPTGVLGVHDFMLGKKVEGILHIILTFIVFFFCNGLGEMVCKSVGNCNSSGEVETFYRSTLILGVLFVIGSYVWALFEGSAIDETIAARHRPAQRPLSPAEIERIKMENRRRNRRIKRKFSIASVVIGAIETMTLPSLLLTMGNVAVGPGGGILFAIPMGMIAYITPFVTALTITFGILGIGEKENGKISLLPFLGIFLGAIGAFLAMRFLHGF